MGQINKLIEEAIFMYPPLTQNKIASISFPIPFNEKICDQQEGLPSFLAHIFFKQQL